MKKYIILIIFINVFVIHAQENEQSFWNILKGKELETSISFLPAGTHYTSLEFNEVWYTSFNYKSYEIAAFKNSFNELTLAALYKRQIGISEKLSLIYGIGIMYGYHGKLVDVPTIPFRKSFLFTGEINPLIGLTLDYRFAKNFSFQVAISPAVAIYGIRYIF
ncbi:hypothetical protein [Polaribacter porphyrae]|uniref:Uncharacterized protein n=1 Tax=Polaribacter porphyrae TaxID=1137780 RepID=A0A2S7WPM5_9FLAO|nr:hypothetical protein [Polaribacter porphyrae]PQJ79533.1 hypothetical protein BTO18_10280 [Polaribacter porphyrae]